MNHNYSASTLSKQISSQESSDFDYSTLDTETYTIVQQRTSKIKTLMHRTAQDMIDIGQNLLEVKQHLGHGHFRKWLNSEFSWSLSAANKFMHVAQQFKCVNFTHLNITTSALYLLAAPSTSSLARLEAIERVNIGEKITYAKAKEIIGKHKKTASPKKNQSAILDAAVANVDCEPNKSLTTLQYQLSNSNFASDALPKKVEPQISSPCFTDIKLASTSKLHSSVNQAEIHHNTLDETTTKIAISIKNLTPEQLAIVINKSVSDGLSNHHLETIIATSQQALKQRQQVLAFHSKSFHES
ncbi:hypothetical protein NUACC21_66580 [Scytonema sp. NUACC21]